MFSFQFLTSSLLCRHSSRFQHCPPPLPRRSWPFLASFPVDDHPSCGQTPQVASHSGLSHASDSFYRIGHPWPILQHVPAHPVTSSVAPTTTKLASSSFLQIYTPFAHPATACTHHFLFVFCSSGLSQRESSSLVCHLHKSLYGLKQSSRVSFGRFSTVVQQFGMIRSEANHYVFHCHTARGSIYLIVYVDDIVITSNDNDVITQVK